MGFFFVCVWNTKMFSTFLRTRNAGSLLLHSRVYNRWFTDKVISSFDDAVKDISSGQTL